MKEFNKKVYLADTDSAGRIFFSRLLEILHEVYEEFLKELGYALSDVIKNHPFSLPITHVEIDFLSPISLGMSLKIHLKIHEIREHSFSIGYEVFGENDRKVATALSVHTSISKDTGKKIKLPEDLKHRLVESH